MKIDYPVPFYANTDDDTHCFQAAIRMVLKYFIPEQEFSWDDLDTITAMGKGLWTWPQAGVLWLHERGFNVRFIEGFDNAEFARSGEKYLLCAMGEEVGQEQIRHSDITRERKYALELVKKDLIEKRIPTFLDIESFLEQGYILICNVNAKILNEEIGYIGHFVVVKGVEESDVLFHDPGYPPKADRRVDRKVFEKAWAYPNFRARNFIALKLSD